jgi:uncharacterized protein
LWPVAIIESIPFPNRNKRVAPQPGRHRPEGRGTVLIAYLDTSALVAYYCPEAISDRVEELLAGENRFAVSHLTEVELISAVSRKIRERQLAKADGNKILTLFQNHIQGDMFINIPVEAKHFSMATNWIAQFSSPLRTLDALHLSLAAGAGMPILTADHQLRQSAEILGVDVFGVFDPFPFR